MKYTSALLVILLTVLVGWYVFFVQSGHPTLGVKLGLDLAGGTELVYKADTGALVGSKQDALNSLRDVIERRVNVFGVAEPLVQLEKSSALSGIEEDRLLVELPGVTDVKAAVDAIGQTPLLEFRLATTTVATTGTSTVGFVATELTGRYLKDAELQFGAQGTGALAGQPIIIINFNEEGSQLFADITKANVGGTLAIFLDGEPISAPTIQEEIIGGTAQITGQFTAVEARDLVRNLNFGALPVPINLISSNSVGPTLGGEAFDAGIEASIIGSLLVALFMILWYRLPGFIACIALVLYILMTIALMKFIPITLTASGIAAFILSIGMAVDANVLIFERMKEELRAKKPPKEAAHLGFERAWPAIRDGHFTMIISSVILFSMGTSIVQGFALVFGLGVIISLISAVMITRVLLFAVLPAENSSLWNTLLEVGIFPKKKT